MNTKCLNHKTTGINLSLSTFESPSKMITFFVDIHLTVKWMPNEELMNVYGDKLGSWINNYIKSTKIYSNNHIYVFDRFFPSYNQYKGTTRSFKGEVHIGLKRESNWKTELPQFKQLLVDIEEGVKAIAKEMDFEITECRKPRAGIKKGDCKSKSPRTKKAVAQYTLDGELIKVFDCREDAADAMGCTKELISAAARGSISSAKGYKWKYILTASETS